MRLSGTERSEQGYGQGVPGRTHGGPELMGGQRFDHLARALSVVVSQRGCCAPRVRAEQVEKPLCHSTGAASNPWEVIEVAKPAWESQFAHGDGVFCSDAHSGACGNAGQAPATCGGGGV